MAVEHLMYSTASLSSTLFEISDLRAVPRYECELMNDGCPVTQLRAALAREAVLLLQKDELIQQQKTLNRESDHRLLNGMQMIVSLLSLQSRAATNPETVSQLAVAANRVATIQRVHQRLHCLDGVQTVAFKQYLEDFCRDFSALLSSEEDPERGITVEGIEIRLPTTTATPLGFIVNELITNAAKYGKGHITVTLELNPEKGYAVSVSNSGQVLPDGYDPAAGKGLGMKIIRSFLRQISGELRFGTGDENRGARFTVLFP